MDVTAAAIDLARTRDAQRVLAPYFGTTPLNPVRSLSTSSRSVFLKLETDLPTGSFKVRGAIYGLSVNLQRQRVAEVVAASTGNHGAAVAYAGRLLGVAATIFVPRGANPVKIARIRDLGGQLVEDGADLSAAIDAAAAYARGRDALFLHDASDPDIPVGAGTIGAEIIEGQRDVDTIYVPMGDTALVRGVASSVKQLRPSTTIVGVVAERAPAYYLSWRAGEALTATADTIADGLAVTRPLAPNVAAVRALVDRVAVVSDEQMLAAIGWLSEHEGVTAEPAGAAATAALLADNPAHGCIALLVTGRNVDPRIADRVRASVP